MHFQNKNQKEMQKQKPKNQSLLKLVAVMSAIVATALIYAVAVLSSGQTLAATGINETLNYQGRLLTATGAVVPDGSYNIEFKVTQDGDGCNPTSGTFPCSGTVEWTETREGSNKVLVKNGYFSVYLGSVTPFGASVDWNQDTLWLSVNIGGTGSPSYDGVMKPLTRLSSTPYALNSKLLGGRTANEYVQLTPSSQQSGSINVSGTISSGQINGQTISSAAIFGGTVAVQGSNALVLGTSTTSDGAIVFKNTDGSNTVTLKASATNPASSFNIVLPSAPGSVNECLRNDSTTPGTLIFGTCVAGTNPTLQDTYGYDTDGLDNVIALTAGDGSLIFRNPASGGTASTFALTVEQLNTGAKDAVIITQAGTGYALRVNDDGTNSDTTAFVIDQGGNVGVGTVTPTDKLYVAGNIMIGAQADVTSHAFASVCACLTNSAAGTFGAETAIDRATSTAMFNGKMYVSTSETDNAAIYRYDGGTTYTKVTDTTPGKVVTADLDNIDAFVLTVFNGKLYAGSQTGLNVGALYEYNGATWAQVNAVAGTFGTQTLVDGISDLQVWNGQLYVATQETNAAMIYRYDGASTFTSITFGPGEILTADAVDMDAVTLISFGGHMWAGARTGGSTARVYKYDGTSATGWYLAQATRGTFGAQAGIDDVTAMAVADGQLFIGVGEANLANIYVYKGSIDRSAIAAANTDWQTTTTTSGRIDATADATDIDAVPMLRNYNGRLYAGSSSTNLAALYEYVGTSSGVTNGWKIVNTTRGTFGAQTGVDSIETAIAINGVFYVGTNEANVGSVYAWTKTLDNSYNLGFEVTSGARGSLSFVGGEQAQSNSNRQGKFVFSNAVALSSGAFDYAEDYPSLDSTLEPGEPVSVDPRYPEHVKRAGPGDTILGVVSESPGLRLSSDAEPASGASWVPIALVGRVPVKVNTAAGEIQPGDNLALSETPGVLKKAGKYGQVVGSALESYNSQGVSKIMMYVNPGVYLSDQWMRDLSNSVDGIMLSSIDGLTIEGENGEQVTQLDRLGNATFAGTVKADKIIATQIEGLKIIGPTELLDIANFHKLVTFNDMAVFKQDIQFLGRASFNNDTGGFATIKKGDTEVEIKFAKPYIIKPVVTVNLSDGQFLMYTYKELTETGFKIILRAPAQEDAQFSWTAFAIVDPITQVSKPPEDIDQLE